MMVARNSTASRNGAGESDALLSRRWEWVIFKPVFSTVSAWLCSPVRAEKTFVMAINTLGRDSPRDGLAGSSKPWM